LVTGALPPAVTVRRQDGTPFGDGVVLAGILSSPAGVAFA
jgi:hypothetical protein